MRGLALGVVMTIAACGGSGDAPTITTGSLATGCADVIDATVAADGGVFTISATVGSADTGWDKYADAWQVRDATGEILGERVLTHPHENEQPFTRDLSGVAIPEGIAKVTIAARDSVEGFCGEVFVAEVPGR